MTREKSNLTPFKLFSCYACAPNICLKIYSCISANQNYKQFSGCILFVLHDLVTHKNKLFDIDIENNCMGKLVAQFVDSRLLILA